MKNLKLFACILAAILLVLTVYAAVPSRAAGVDTTTMNVGTIGEPKNVDPSQAYDTSSGELIMNVYDSMLEFGSASSNLTVKDASFPTGNIPQPVNDSCNVGTDVAILGSTTDIPGVCQLPTVTITNPATGACVFTFQVNTNLEFQNWTDPHGNVVIENMTWQDIVYYFERFFVQDSHNSPEWMLLGPAFAQVNGGAPNFDAWEVGTTSSLGSNEAMIAGWIQNWVIGWTDPDGTQWVNMTFQAAPTGIYDILCQTWCCIPPMDFSIAHGCWNDSFSVSPYATSNGVYTQTGFAAGWSAAWRRYPSDLFTPLDEHTATSQYSSSSAEPAMCGTGPYSFTTWNQATDYWRIDQFDLCVSHPWTNGGPYGLSDPAPIIVTSTGINTWATRKMLFLSGALDICYVPEANMFDMLVPGASIGNDYTPITGIELYYDIPTLETDACFFTLNVTAGSPYTPIVNGNPDPTFFDSVLIRSAFCQALNSSAYLSGAFYGEATQPNTWWAVGLTPPGAYLNSTQLPAWELNYTAVYDDLQAAGVTTLTLDLAYNVGNTERQIAAQEMAETFEEINAMFGTKYAVTAVPLNWPTFLAAYETGSLPTFIVGWLADFSDADDFAVPYMETGGAFTSGQGFSNSTIDNLLHLEEALSSATPVSNITAYNLRNSYLEQLQIDYIQNAISLPLDQPLGRHWQASYVYGYYYNQLYPGLYYQDLYKKVTGTFTPVNVDITDPITSIGTTYNNVYIYGANESSAGAETIFYTGGVPAIMTFNITVRRTDSEGGYVGVEIALIRVPIAPTNLSNTIPSVPESFEYPNSTYVLVGDTGSQSVILQWYEDGVSVVMPANATWMLGAQAALAPGQLYSDSNTNDKYVNDTVLGGVNSWTMSNPDGTYASLLGDLNGDGVVNILDAILLSDTFGLGPSDPGYNPAACLTTAGPLGSTINILDAIILAGQFGMYFGFPGVTPP